MNIFEQIAEGKIRAGIEAGEFDSLAGSGRPLDLDSLRGVRSEDRAAFTLLRNSGFVPDEVTTRRELAAVEAKLARGPSGDTEYERLLRQRTALELKRNLQTERRLGSKH
jgi:hypothetical protein